MKFLLIGLITLFSVSTFAQSADESQSVYKGSTWGKPAEEMLSSLQELYNNGSNEIEYTPRGSNAYEPAQATLTGKGIIKCVGALADGPDAFCTITAKNTTLRVDLDAHSILYRMRDELKDGKTNVTYISRSDESPLPEEGTARGYIEVKCKGRKGTGPRGATQASCIIKAFGK